MTISAEIPKKISYVYYPQARSREGFMMLPAFPVDPTNKGRMETAKRWAENHYSTTVYKNGKYIQNPEKKEDIVIEEYDNDPISGVKIVDLEVRGNGGRAYKIALPNKLFVDMREDVLMEVIMKRGVSPGGILNGEFIWCRVGSETKLVLVGSDLHKECLEAMKFKTKDLLQKEFEVGKLYQSTSSYILYCGKVFCKTQKGKIVTRDAWLSLPCPDKQNPVKAAVKKFLKAIEDKNIKDSNFYSYKDENAIKAHVGKMGKVLEITISDHVTDMAYDFSKVNEFLPEIVKIERTRALSDYLGIKENFRKYKTYSPAKAKAEAAARRASDSWYSWGYGMDWDRNPHEYYNQKYAINGILKDIDCLTVSIDKTTCEPVHEDLIEFFGMEDSKAWEPKLT